MVSFESELKDFLKNNNIAFTDNCASYKHLDFTLNNFFNKRNVYIDVKEKRQKINTSNWPSVSDSDEIFTFIMDDLAVRKIIAFAPYSGIIIRDNTTMNYYWLSAMDMALMPRHRVNRPIEKNSFQYKGKWIIDLRNACLKTTLHEIVKSISFYCDNLLDISTQHLPCYGNYINENITVEGEVRKPSYWDKDVKETR